MRNWLIRKLGGTPNDEVLTSAVKHLFNTIGSDDILKEVGGQWTAGGKILSDGQKKLMVSEAKTILSTTVWRVLQVDIKYRANKAMFEKSRSELDLIAGKLWLYILDSLNTRLDSLSAGHGTFNDDAQRK